MAQHEFAEIALGAIGAGDGVAALDVAVLAAGDIGRRADRDAVLLAVRVVVADVRRPARRAESAARASASAASSSAKPRGSSVFMPAYTSRG